MSEDIASTLGMVEGKSAAEVPRWPSVGPFPIRLISGKTMFIAKVEILDVKFEVEGLKENDHIWKVFMFENDREIANCILRHNYNTALHIAVSMMRSLISRKSARFGAKKGHSLFLRRAIAEKEEQKEQA